MAKDLPSWKRAVTIPPMPTSIRAVPMMRCKSQAPGMENTIQRMMAMATICTAVKIWSERPSMGVFLPPSAHSMKSIQSILNFNQCLFDQALAHGVDEVRIGGLLAAGAHQACDLPAMIRRVQDDVGQNVFHGACPRLTLAVLVDDCVGESRGRKLAEEISPELSDLGDLLFTLVEGEIRPDGQALRLFPDALQPEPLSRDNVRQELTWPQRRIDACLQAGKHFAVRPLVVGKLAAQMF